MDWSGAPFSELKEKRGGLGEIGREGEVPRGVEESRGGIRGRKEEVAVFTGMEGEGELFSEDDEVGGLGERTMGVLEDFERPEGAFRGLEEVVEGVVRELGVGGVFRCLEEVVEGMVRELGVGGVFRGAVEGAEGPIRGLEAVGETLKELKKEREDEEEERLREEEEEEEAWKDVMREGVWVVRGLEGERIGRFNELEEGEEEGKWGEGEVEEGKEEGREEETVEGIAGEAREENEKVEVEGVGGLVDKEAADLK